MDKRHQRKTITERAARIHHDYAPLQPPQNPKANEARAAICDYLGVVIDGKRPPLSPALLSQAASVERDTCFGYDDEQHIIGSAMPSERGQVIVTWKGREIERNHDKQTCHS